MERVIINDDQENFDRILGQTNFNDISNQELEQYFLSIFYSLALYNRPKLLQTLSEHWDSLHGNILQSESTLPLQSWLFTQNIPTHVLRAIDMPEISLIGVVTDLINYQDTPQMFAAVLRAVDYFQESNEYTYRVLLQLCGDGNKYIYNALVDRLVMISEFAPIPSWVKQEWLPEEEIFDLAKKRRKELGRDIKARLEDPLLFQLLGPANSDGEKEERMLTTITYDWDEDYFDWFDGYCENCYRRIRSIEHCLRAPMFYGSWQGCFCSFLCTMQYIEKGDNLDEIIFCLEILKVLKPKLEKVGILGREENPPERAEEEKIDFAGEIAKYLPSEDMVDSIQKIKTRQDFENLFVKSCENLHQFAYREGQGVVAGYYSSQGHIICQFDRPVILLIAKKGCYYCMRFKPWFISLSQREARVDFAELYNDQPAFQSVVEEYGITQFPSVILFYPFREDLGRLQFRVLMDSEKIKEDLPMYLNNI